MGTKKTIEEHLFDLPVSISIKAVSNYRSQRPKSEIKIKSNSEALIRAFEWSKSPEKKTFWESIYKKLIQK